MTKNKTHKDYKNAKIYIVRNILNESTYIGSTTQTLSQRMAQHRKATRNPKANSFKIYRTMLELGIDNFFIELIEYYNCNTQEELRRREGEIIRNFQPDLNKQVAGRTMQEYYNDNLEQIRQRDRDRFSRNQETVLQRRKERKYECCCGSVVRTDGRAEHERTKKHQEFISQNNF